MPRHRYIQLQVMCSDLMNFPLDQLREAVEYLRHQPQTGYTGLIAQADVETEQFKLLAQPMLQLSEIIGKTPAEVWDAFDADVDRQVAGLIERYAPEYGNQRG